MERPDSPDPTHTRSSSRTPTTTTTDSRPLTTDRDRTPSETTLGPTIPAPPTTGLFAPTASMGPVISQAELGLGQPPLDSSSKGKGPAFVPTVTSASTSSKSHGRNTSQTTSTGSSTLPTITPSRNTSRLPGILQSESLSRYTDRQASMASSTRPFSSTGSGAETESLQSDDLGELSDTYDSEYYDLQRTKGTRVGGSGGGGGRGKVKTSGGGKVGGAAMGRARSVSRVRDLMDEDEDEREGGGGRERPMSPIGNRLVQVGDEDDEVERRDRGEELVRKRMRDRTRLKKEAEKATRKREIDARATRMQIGAARRMSYNPASLAQTQAELLDPDPDPTPPRFSRRATTDGPASRNVSRAGFRDTSFSALGSGGPTSPSGSDAGYFSSASTAGTERGVSPSPYERESLYAPLSPGAGGRSHIPSGRRSIIGEERTIGEMEEETTEVEQGGGDDDEEEDEDEEEDDDPDGVVEYTLKDRQDAINIEHPFGLPIWKPALYKKNRSVHRNAETALHATPSSTVVHHLAPGNILWTLFFGSWLALICLIVSAVLWCVPWGGSKYGRVIFELGSYLFWPFGKYVEGWSDQIEGEEEEEDAGYEDVEEEEEEEEEEGHGSASRRLDLEDAGKTFGRSRGREYSNRSNDTSQRNTLRPGSVVDNLWTSSGDPNDLPDEPRRSSGDTIVQSVREVPSRSSLNINERSGLLANQSKQYGTTLGENLKTTSSSESTLDASRLHDFGKDDNGDHSFRVRALGRVMYWLGFYLIVAPVMLIACVLCWGMVFTVPMAKLLWVLLRHLSNEPLSLHFRSPPEYAAPTATGTTDFTNGSTIYPLRAGQRAPRISRKSVADAKAHGRLFGPRSTVLLCTYRAAGLQYYKYTVDGVNILFINLLSLVFFVIADFFLIAPYVEKHNVGGFLAFISGQAAIFTLALLSVIPLSYFIGMAVASISAQSSIGMGAVINASFGSIIEIILYCIALTQKKAELVEGSIVGSILAAVLLMPGLSMIGGAMRRKEQKFNARSAGVTSTMLIMAIIGILTPTLFYEIYGSFQLTCSGCDPNHSDTTSSCRTCYYEHIDPVDDAFYQNTVKYLSYWCALILVCSYLVGLWFSLRTHASQIWQNAQVPHEQGVAHRPTASQGVNERASIYQRVLPAKWAGTPLQTPSIGARQASGKRDSIPPMTLPQTMSSADFHRAVEATTVIPIHHPRQPSHVREVSHSKGEEAEGGGHDAPNWSRTKSAGVLMGCTALYAVIAEILVDVVDVVLDGSGIPEKFLGVTLFALVPNTTEFMNAISFAINGNIALSMEIGSAYALQVCLIQAPAMLAFTAYYAIGKDSMAHQAFTLVFPRWDVIAIIFSVFLLTYTYIEARANYYRGSILCFSYLVLLGGFYFSPNTSESGDYEPAPTTLLLQFAEPVLSSFGHVQALFLSLFTR